MKAFLCAAFRVVLIAPAALTNCTVSDVSIKLAGQGGGSGTTLGGGGATSTLGDGAGTRQNSAAMANVSAGGATQPDATNAGAGALSPAGSGGASQSGAMASAGTTAGAMFSSAGSGAGGGLIAVAGSTPSVSSGGGLAGPYCGDGRCGFAENMDNCCKDCDCANDGACHRGSCVVPVEISAGANHNCVLLQGGLVECWGCNTSGQLGNGTATNSASPVRVENLTGARMVSGGRDFTCAATAGGTVLCWGANGSGQLGNGTQLPSTVPVQVNSIYDAIGVAAGDSFACAILSNATVKCWGKNSHGQLGNGTRMDTGVPVATANLTGVTDLAAGTDFACARLSDGTVRCWGNNYRGQLGNDTTTLSTTPVQTSNLSNAVQIVATQNGSSSSACALTGDGTVQCWGDNMLGTLGNANAGTERHVPIGVANLEHAMEISAGNMHVCAAISESSVKCWGSNTAGQLGVGQATHSASTPVNVSNLTRAIHIAAGDYHTCALVGGGDIRCWGDNGLKQLGTDAVASSSEPITLAW